MNIPSVEVGHNISSRELGLDKSCAGSKNACNNEVQARTILRIYGLKSMSKRTAKDKGLAWLVDDFPQCRIWEGQTSEVVIWLIMEHISMACPCP